MKRNRQHGARVMGALLLASAVAAPAASEEAAFEPGWQLRVYAASVDFSGGEGYGPNSRPDYDLDVGFGFGIGAEYRFSRRLGVDIGILGAAAIDVTWSTVGPGEWVWSGYDTLTFSPLSAGLDIHLIPDNDVDLYLSPQLAWIHYGGLVVRSGSGWSSATIDFDEDLGLGLALGLAAPLGRRERWAFVANLTFLESSLETDSWSGARVASDYSATILGLGFGYRF